MAETLLVDGATVAAAASCAVADYAAAADIVTFRIECDQPHTLEFWGADASFDDTDDAARYEDETRTYVAPTEGTGSLYLIDTGGKAFLCCIVTNDGTANADVTVAAEGARSADFVALLEAIAAIEIPTTVDIDADLSASHGAGTWGEVLGRGVFEYTITDVTTGLPISGAFVEATTDDGGANVVAAAFTDDFGVARLLLNAGTYYLWRKAAGYQFTNPDVETISA